MRKKKIRELNGGISGTVTGSEGDVSGVGRILERPLQAHHTDSCMPPWQDLWDCEPGDWIQLLAANSGAYLIETSNAFPFSTQHTSKGCGRTGLCHLGRRDPEVLCRSTLGPTRLRISISWECRRGAAAASLSTFVREHVCVLKSRFPSR